MARIINTTSTITIHPTSLDSNTTTCYSSSSIANGYDDATSTTYAQFYLNRGSRAQTIVDYEFEDPDIPSGATIDSVSCRAKTYISQTNANRITTRQIQLYAGDTAKGSAYTIGASTSSYAITAGSWTAVDLKDAKIRMNIVRGTSSTNSSYYVRFYGATLTIDYSLSTTAYTITGSSNVSNVFISPTTQEVYANEDADEIRIDAASIDDIVVTDNGNDITSSLIRHDNTAGSFTASFIPSSFDETNSVYDHTVGDNGVYSTNYISNGLTDHNSTTRCALYSVRSNGTNSKMYYNFDCSSIPANAIITSVTCSIKAGSQGSTYYSNYQAYLCSGTTIKTTAVTVDGSNTSPSTEYISGGSWTRAELQNAKILFQVTANSSTEDSTWSFYGATLNVSYTVPATNPYYWTYELTNVNADHIILIEEAGVYIPPEEDPEETYWPVTISSINATTDPPNGTTRVVEGSNMTVTISPTDPQLTLALDNGVDITSQLQGGTPTNTYTVTTQVSGASYGFPLNSGTGYYTSNNDGVSSSAAVARVNFNFETECLVTIQYINYAEATYDYGIFGQIDTALSTSYTADSNAYHTCNASSDNTSAVQTLTYTIPAGTHFIDIKYRKDNYTDSNNDDLRWKISDIEVSGAGGDYTYTLTNITQKHSLIFVFGDVTFYYITSSGSSGARLFPDGQQVKLEGDSYRLNIVPDDTSATVTITDNNVDVTSSLEYNSDYKNGVLVVSYTYKISNIQANHNIVVNIGGVSTSIFIKENGVWVEYSKVYKKINGSWVEQADLSSVFNTSTKYVRRT